MTTISRPLAPTLPGAEAVMAHAEGENFPVASRVLPHAARRHLLAIYGFARLVDQIGDEELPGDPLASGDPSASVGSSAPGDSPASGDPLAALDWLEGELDRAFHGHAEHPLLVALQPTLSECQLPRAPFVALIEANRQDQRVTRYETWEHLLGYCKLSANPIGELVLSVLGVATPERIALSDSICTALQLAEHWQDVAEDAARGRVYLPAEDLARFGCEERDLRASHAGEAPRGSGEARRGAGEALRGSGEAPRGAGEALRGSGEAPRGAGEALRGLLALEVARTHELLDRGAPLVGTLRGRAKLAVAAFVGGGRAALDAIERARYDVLGGPPRAGQAGRVLATVGALAGRSRSGRARPGRPRSGRPR